MRSVISVDNGMNPTTQYSVEPLIYPGFKHGRETAQETRETALWSQQNDHRDIQYHRQQ
jgi:hypothetical protein